MPSRKLLSTRRKPHRVSRQRSVAPAYRATPAKWVQEAADARARRELQRRIAAQLKTVRALYSGFEASAGFDLRKVQRWPESRFKTFERFANLATRLTTGEFHSIYTLARPRTPAQRQALFLHTSQVSPDEKRHPQKAWVVYANVRNARVRYVEERVPVGAAMGRPIYRTWLRAEIVQPVRGGVLVHRDYLFREVLGFQPGVESAEAEGLRMGRVLGTFDPWEQMVEAMELLVELLPDRTPQGNEAYYRLLSVRGPIGTSVPKHMLVSRIIRWGEEYDPDFAEQLIGVRYQGDEFKAVRGSESLDAKSEKRRAQYRRWAYEERLARARVVYQPVPDTQPRSRLKGKRQRSPVKQIPLPLPRSKRGRKSSTVKPTGPRRKK